MDVGIRELKQRLSHYLDLVEAGEIVRVTDRGTPKAIITPLPGRGALERGIDEGWIRPASRTGLQPVKGWASTQKVLDVLEADRSE